MEPDSERLWHQNSSWMGEFLCFGVGFVGFFGLGFFFLLIQSRLDDFHGGTETLLRTLGMGCISEGDGGDGEQREGTTWTVTSSCGSSAPSRASRDGRGPRASRDGRGPSRCRGLLPRLWCRGRFTVSALARGVKLFLLILTGLCLLGRPC